jgi:uncharacterized membrane protein HdeD (DUF308 family)
MNDLRRPTGFLFALLGLILTLYGVFNSGVRAPLDSNINVNLWCGVMLLVFGGCLLWLGYRAKS